MGNTYNFESDRAQYRVLLVLEALSQGPLSAAEIADRVHASRATVSIYLGHVGARVADWRDTTTGNIVPLYDDRPGPDTPRPPPLTRQERNRRQWARLRGDDVEHERRKARRRNPNRPDKAAAWITRDIT